MPTAAHEEEGDFAMPRRSAPVAQSTLRLQFTIAGTEDTDKPHESQVAQGDYDLLLQRQPSPFAQGSILRVGSNTPILLNQVGVTTYTSEDSTATIVLGKRTHVVHASGGLDGETHRAHVVS